MRTAAAIEAWRQAAVSRSMARHERRDRAIDAARNAATDASLAASQRTIDRLRIVADRATAALLAQPKPAAVVRQWHGRAVELRPARRGDVAGWSARADAYLATWGPTQEAALAGLP